MEYEAPNPVSARNRESVMRFMDKYGALIEEAMEDSGANRVVLHWPGTMMTVQPDPDEPGRFMWQPRPE
jgi:hypothetical protein